MRKGCPGPGRGSRGPGRRADYFVNYRWKVGKTVHKVALNLKNITDKQFYTNTGRLNYGFESRLSYNLNF